MSGQNPTMAHGMELLRLVILGNAMHHPVALGCMLMKLEAFVLGELDGNSRCISRCLHEMNRDGLISLTNRGNGWIIRLGPNGHRAFFQLMHSHPCSRCPVLQAIQDRLRQHFADLLRDFTASGISGPCPASAH